MLISTLNALNLKEREGGREEGRYGGGREGRREREGEKKN